MARLIAIRAIQGLVTLLAVSLLLYLGTQLLPGDVASALLGHSATPETVAALRAKLGLDQPAWQRYLGWLWGIAHGDFGESLASGRPVAAQILPRLANTLFLASYAAIISIPIAVGAGIVAAIREGSFVDRALSSGSLVAISVPEFFVGYVLIAILAVNLGWLPSLATVFPGLSFAGRVLATTLPALTLTLVVVAHAMRMTRASLLAVMSTPYIEMCFLKGLTRTQVVVGHALRNAAGPIIAVVALDLAYLVVGVVVVEVVFVYPGIGQLMVDAVSKRDLPVVQACGIIFGAAYILLNTVADLAAIVANPRLRRR